MAQPKRGAVARPKGAPRALASTVEAASRAAAWGSAGNPHAPPARGSLRESIKSLRCAEASATSPTASSSSLRDSIRSLEEAEYAAAPAAQAAGRPSRPKRFTRKVGAKASREKARAAALAGHGVRALSSLARAACTEAAKKSRLATWDSLAAACEVDGFNLDADGLQFVAGSLLEGNYASTAMYVADALQRFRKNGGQVSEQMQEVVNDVNRAAKRLPKGRRARGSLGPIERLATGAWPQVAGGPRHAKACGFTGIWWMLRDASLIDLDRGDVQVFAEGEVLVTSTSDKATEPTITRALGCLCKSSAQAPPDSAAAALGQACPACIVTSHVALLDLEWGALNGGAAYPRDAPLFPREDGRRPTPAAMYAFVDAVGDANGIRTRNVDGSRCLGRHIWRRTSAKGFCKLISRPLLAGLGNWTSSALESYLEVVDEWDTVEVPNLVAAALGGVWSTPAKTAGDALLSAADSSMAGSLFPVMADADEAAVGIRRGRPRADQCAAAAAAAQQAASDGGEVADEETDSGEATLVAVAPPTTRATAATKGTVCRGCLQVQRGSEFAPASMCSLCHARPFHARCLWKNKCGNCGGGAEARERDRHGSGGRASTSTSSGSATASKRAWAPADLVVRAGGGVIHMVKVADKGIPASSWRTLCGWKFAETGEAPASSGAAVTCPGCKGSRSGR